MALALSLVGLLAVPAPALAQCDQDKIQKRSGGASGYREVRPGFCEGIYGKDVSGAVLTFVGLTGDYSLQGYDRVRISAAAPDGPVHVRAQSWDDQAFQMDARVEESLDWDVGLLRSEGIPLERIGFLGWVGDGEERLYLPLSVFQDEPDPRPRYSVRVLPNARLEEVSVTLAKVEAAGQEPVGSLIRDRRVLPQADFPLGRPFRFRIGHDEVGSPGVYYVRVHATQEGEIRADELTFWFHHAGGS